MKFIFIAVPQWYPVSPYLAQAILTGQLKQAGYDAFSYDLNIEFFNDILKKDFVLECAGNAKAMLPSLFSLYKSLPDAEKNYGSFDKKTKTALARLKTVSEYFEKSGDGIARVAEETENAVRVLKSKEDFYDPEKLFHAKDTLVEALRIISLPWAPSRIMLDNFIANPVMTYGYEDVKQQCFDETQNMFIPYFEKKFSSIPLEDCECVNISITDLSQLIPALTLGRMVKEKTGKKVCFGGNYIFKIINELKSFPEFFGLFCDYVIPGDGEIAAVEFADFISGKKEIGQVHSLVYKDVNGNVVTNETAPLLNLRGLSYPDFAGYDFSKYFSPETVMPVQLGKGCYWGKCEFCDFYTGQQKFDMKDPVRAADEVEYLSRKYSTDYFVFVDECVPPKFYEKFADELLSRGLHIHFYSFARFDAGFTKEVLSKLKKAGAEYFSWGYETKPERLLKLMNKGISPDVRDRILRDCVDIGMWTQCTFLLGYPTETPEELQQTIDVIEDRTLINSCTPSNFVLKKNAILKDDADSVGLHDKKSNGEFHISYSYSSSGVSMEQVKHNRLVFEKRFLEETADSMWSLGFTDTDHLLLFLSRYGRDFVRDYRLSFKKKNPT